jgi:transcriptional regulator GlxA family with amidase domain
LAEAGLLDGRRATTHWAYAQELQERFPKVKVEMDLNKLCGNSFV